MITDNLSSPFSPLDPSAEEKAQDTFARLYEEHVTSSNTENQTKTTTKNNKTIHIQQSESKNEEQKYERNKTSIKNSFLHLPSNGGVTSNCEDQVRKTTNPSPQLQKGPLGRCSDGKSVTTHNSTSNTHQNVFRENRVINNEEQSSTITTNTSTDAFVKNTLHQEQENRIITKTSTNKNSLHQENISTTKMSTDVFLDNSHQQENTTGTKTNADSFMKATPNAHKDTSMNNSSHHLHESNTGTSSKSSVSSMCQETSTKRRYDNKWKEFILDNSYLFSYRDAPESKVHIIPISLVDQHPDCARDFLDVDKLAKAGDIPGNRSKTEEGCEEGESEKNFKDPTQTETKQGVESKGRMCTGAKQTEIRVSEIKHPERQTIVPLESSHIEIVPKTEIRLAEPKEVIRLESSLPPLEDPSVILLSPSSTRRSESTILNEAEPNEDEKSACTNETKTHENSSESLDIKQLTTLQKQMTKNKHQQMGSTATNSSLSSRHEDYADLVEEVKHIKEDKARFVFSSVFVKVKQNNNKVKIFKEIRLFVLGLLSLSSVIDPSLAMNVLQKLPFLPHKS